MSLAIAFLTIGAMTMGNFSPSAGAETYKALVTSIIDGDTVDVSHEGQKVRLRLRDIDCPELGQPYGRKARRFTGTLAFNQTVTVHTFGQDPHGRTLAEITLPGGMNLNQELVRVGYAWVGPHVSHDGVLTRLEMSARKWPRGLWVESRPIEPWEWRKTHPQKPHATKHRRHR
jgi:endonuclease YncB( thermonuclease family)